MQWKVPAGLFALLAISVAALVVYTDRPDSDRKLSVSVAGESVAPRPSASPQAEEFAARYCKNPYEVTCANGSRPTQDPTGVVNLEVASEVRALRQLRAIVRAHPDWTSKQVEEELARVIYTEKRRNRVESAFVWVRSQLEGAIQRQPDAVFSDEEKAALRERVRSVKLEMPPPAEVYADAVDLFTKNTLYYERTVQGVLRLRVGGAFLLNVSSWFNLVFSLAHEFAHAIDPCEMEAAHRVPRAYPDLVSCFVKTGWVEESRSRCGPNEQVSEVFADWMATEVLSAALVMVEDGYSLEDRVRSVVNSVRDLCEDPTDTDTQNLSNHQSPRVRIDEIVGRAPKVRVALGCEKKKTPLNYCHFMKKGSP